MVRAQLSNNSSTITSNNAVNPVPLGLPALTGSPLLQYDRADRCFVTTTRRTPIYPRDGSWVRAEGSNPQIVAHQQLVSYYQRHPPAHPEDVFATLRINVEPAQITEKLQSPVNEQSFELPDVQYVPIEAPDTEPPPVSFAPTNTPVEPPMSTFTQADIDQRIAAALDTYRLQQSTANRPLRLDIPAPEPFSGKAEDLRRFLQCVLSYFVATNNTRLSDEAKIAFTVALMRKDLGKTWADAYYEKSAGGVQIVAHQQLVSYYQRHPPAHPEDVFATLRINVEPAQITEKLQSPVNEQSFELPDVQYVPIEAPDTEPPPVSFAPTNTPVEPPMSTFTQADIDQRIAAALDTYRLQQSTANRPLRLDIPAPEPFSGKAEDLRRFLQCVLSYFVATNNTRLSDEAKIAFTVALMRKDLGKTWADAYYEKSAGGVQVYPDWAAFATALEEAFPEHGTRIKAHQILMKLPERQKNKKTALSLGNYATRFEQLASKAQLKDAEVNGVNRTENDYHTLHANFVKGLPKELYVSLATRVARDRPNTMKAWYDEVRNADAAEQGALTVTDTRDYGEPMDIDAAAVVATFAPTSGGRKWELGAVLNEADQKLHRDGNLCFYCHIKGHSAKDCRKKAAARQGGGRPNQGGSGKDDFRARIKALSADEKRELYEELTMEDF
ncbi:hypothetical protein POSPLADRAFT_1058500 [Postia placenta MAD-698-R-SB12]|uniref:CCHC-type domain-containing protein n=1 Tax=Postia placenta MAD-698-R-SB12 TaxID=670580 RepID=A0A1X6MVC5_9APHY|nr:hypothetical protein POSPLADRAFT_1058500 [Postia placenta MAD-698-R-SB12]OSX60327.1 hypothetical protein POSPLADRAFT_1058500 [Postia placenta MAD-698-R-SB12]